MGNFFSTNISCLVSVTVAFLDKTVPADAALVGFVRDMTHDVVPHIAKSKCCLVALTTVQKLVLIASVRVDKCALIEL